MSLRTSYTLLAPVYDWIVGPALAHARARSLHRMPAANNLRILLNGVGTGLDLPLLPAANRYTALDLTRAMLKKALPRGRGLDVTWIQGDSQRLPFGDNTFDHVVLHLILAIVPDTRAALREAARVVQPGGRLFLLDKFLRPGKTAWLRRAINPLVRRIATRTDVVFEDALAGVGGLRVIDDQPALVPHDHAGKNPRSRLAGRIGIIVVARPDQPDAACKQCQHHRDFQQKPQQTAHVFRSRVMTQ